MVAFLRFMADTVFTELQTPKGGTNPPRKRGFFVPDYIGQESPTRKGGGSAFNCLKLLAALIGRSKLQKIKEDIMSNSILADKPNLQNATHSMLKLFKLAKKLEPELACELEHHLHQINKELVCRILRVVAS